MSYFKSKTGSVEEAVKGLQKDLNDSAYQDMFKKELEKTGKGIGSMSPAEKKAFFNKIDSKYKAKEEEAPTSADMDRLKKMGMKPKKEEVEEELSAAQKKLPPALQKAIKDKENKKEEVDEKVDNPYAVGMAAAMKKTGDKPPLKKSTITKAHDIAKSIEKDDKNEDLDKLKEDVAKLIETHTFRANPMNKKQKDTGGEKEVIKPVEDSTGKMTEQTAKNFDLYRAVHSVWTNAADKLDEIKKESKYLKAEEEVEESKDQSTMAKPGDTDSAKEEKGKTMIKSQKTKVDMEPEVEYNK